MILKSIRLKDFRQYKGEQIVTFSTEPNQNVTVILGGNTYGKTTLLQAFNWCFYKKAALYNPDMLLNYEVAALLPEGLSVSVEVEITLIHDNKEYHITTTQEYVKDEEGVRGLNAVTSASFRRDDGQTEPIKASRVESVIQSIIPEGLSNFFFFDTERVSSVSTREDLTESVKALLGLTTLDDALLHVGDREHKRSVIGQLYSEIDQQGNEKAQEALSKMQDAQEKRDLLQDEIEQCQSEIAQLTSRKEQLDLLLRDNMETKALQEQKERLESQVEDDEKSLEITKAALRKEFRRYSVSYFSAPLIDQARDILRETQIDGKGITDLTKTILDELLDRNVCICGLHFDQHPEAVEHVKEEMRYCPPESLGSAVRHYCERLAERRCNQEEILESINERRAMLYSIENRIQNVSDEIDLLSGKLALKADMRHLENERNGVKDQLKTLDRKKDALNCRDGELKAAIEAAQKQYQEQEIHSSKNQRTMRYIAYSEEIRSWLKATYDEKETEIREKLQSRVNSIFEQMYHGTRKVLIDSKYHVKLLSKIANDELESGESEGLNRVKNFAFIAGLVSIAKERIVSKADGAEFDLSSEPYPLVMDAPFSNTDEVHIRNISKALPEVSEQVIMFVMQKDWRYSEPVLGDRVGKRYILDKNSEQFSVLKEL